jgi:Cu/Ag efflux protein CusF
MKSTQRAVLALLVAAAVGAPAWAQNLKRERANILAVDWNAMQVRMKDPKGRETTWVVARDASVVFTDKREEFPNPKLQDLVPPMYVHFTYNGDTKQITAFDVAEVGFDTSKRKEATTGSAGQQTAVITALDANIGHVEVDLASGRRTFEVDPRSQLRNFKVGDRVTLQISKVGDKEVVTRIRKR